MNCFVIHTWLIFSVEQLVESSVNSRLKVKSSDTVAVPEIYQKIESCLVGAITAKYAYS